MKKFKEASFYKKLPEKKVICKLCPHNCVMGSGEYGKCKVRMNIHGNLKSMYYSKPHTVKYEKIEKFPIYHFLPTSETLLVGNMGDNIESEIYKNEFSGKEPQDIPTIDQDPIKIIKQAEKNKVGIISYGYNEPLMSFEYIYDIADNSRRMKHVLITNGFVEPRAVQEISKKLSAALIEIKSMNESFYENMLKANLKDVLKTAKILHNNGVWVELRMRLIPGIHDDLYDVRKLSSWILEELDENVPVHLIGVNNFDSENLIKAKRTMSQAGMNYVYVHGSEYVQKNTICPNCEKPLITRENGVIDSKVKEGKCLCGKEIAGIWH